MDYTDTNLHCVREKIGLKAQQTWLTADNMPNICLTVISPLPNYHMLNKNRRAIVLHLTLGSTVMISTS